MLRVVTITSGSKKPNRMRRGMTDKGTVLCCCLLIPLGVWLGIQAKKPYVYAARQRAINDAREKQANDLAYAIQKAKGEVEGLDNPRGVDAIAREYGWVLPGEHPIRPPAK